MYASYLSSQGRTSSGATGSTIIVDIDLRDLIRMHIVAYAQWPYQTIASRYRALRDSACDHKNLYNPRIIAKSAHYISNIELGKPL